MDKYPFDGIFDPSKPRSIISVSSNPSIKNANPSFPYPRDKNKETPLRRFFVFEVRSGIRTGACEKTIRGSFSRALTEPAGESESLLGSSAALRIACEISRDGGLPRILCRGTRRRSKKHFPAGKRAACRKNAASCLTKRASV